MSYATHACQCFACQWFAFFLGCVEASVHGWFIGDSLYAELTGKAVELGFGKPLATQVGLLSTRVWGRRQGQTKQEWTADGAHADAVCDSAAVSDSAVQRGVLNTEMCQWADHLARVVAQE